MAITGTKDNTTNTQQQRPKQQYETMEQIPVQRTFSLRESGMFKAPISKNIGSDFYLKLKIRLLEIYKNVADPNAELVILDLDNINDPALYYSSIIVAMRYSNMKEIGVAFHVLLLEDTNDKLSPSMENINNQQIENLLVASDAFDDVLMKKAADKVAKAFPNSTLYGVEGCVVPHGFNFDDKNAMYQLALNASWACSTELETHSGQFIDLNLASIKNDSELNINIAFNHEQLPDAVGNLMRSDVKVGFDSRKSGNINKQASINMGDREVKLSEVSGFVDLVWVDPNPVNVFAQYTPPTANSQKYAARLVVTNLTSNTSYTPGTVMLALATTVALRDDNNWIQAFRPEPSNNEIDLRDIGALNIEGNISNEPGLYGTRIDTKSDSFKLEDLGRLTHALVQTGLIFSMDCPEMSAQTWYLSAFSEAANGNKAAYNLLYNVACNLTDGVFANMFPHGTPMFTDCGNRVHNGYWTDKDGSIRDIRDIDHLAVCNLVGDRNPQLIREWTGTFLNTNIPLVTRLAARKRIIMNLTGETAVFTGFSNRVTFTSVFLDCLFQGIKLTGLAVKVNTPLTINDITASRGTATFATQAILAPGTNTFMDPGNAFQQQPLGGFRHNQRWG
jgi:hypothetical protein